MGYKIEQIEGIGAVYAEKLQAAGKRFSSSAPIS